MLLVMCANAGVDRTYEVEGYACGGFHRPSASYVAAGGKGINVARALQALGRQVVVTGLLGGFSGDFVYCDLDRLGLAGEFSRIQGESRTTLAVVDRQNGTVTRLDEPGPEVTEEDVELLCARWAELVRYADTAVISGNPPPGVKPSVYGRLTAAARRQSVPVVLDAHEEHLRQALPAAPDVLTPNLRELSWLSGHPLCGVQDVVDYSRVLTDGGVGTVLTTLGPDGAVVVTASGEAFRVAAPAVDVVSAVGAGDCALAGWVAALEEGRDVWERGRWAVAAGSAACGHVQAAEITRSEVEELLAQTTIEELG
jgi:tagatose 6-phosphate kinase